jgi:hypothetical protein
MAIDGSDDHDTETDDERRRAGFHRHVNPDGSQGGWVGKNANVAPTVYVGRDAEVSGFSDITGDVKILDRARVKSCIVADNATIEDAADISRSIVRDNAVITGRSWIDSERSVQVGANERLVFEGDTRVENVQVYVNHDFVLRLSGGDFKAPESCFQRDSMHLPPRLVIDGAYDKTTGNVQVDYVGVQVGNANDEVVPLPNAQDLMQHVTYAMPRGMDIAVRGQHSARHLGTDSSAKGIAER